MSLLEMTFGQFIKARRLQLGYRQADVARKGGFNQGSLHAWENSLNLPAAGNLIKLSKALELSTEDLRRFNLTPVCCAKAKPIHATLLKIRAAKVEAEHVMSGLSQFEISMKNKLIDALTQCEEIMMNVQFLDEAF